MPSSALAPSLWETVKCDFKSLFPEDVFQMWFEPVVCLETSPDAMTLGVPNDFAAIWIHDNYLDLITQRLRLTAGRVVNVTLRKIDSAPRAGAAATATHGPNGRGSSDHGHASRIKAAAPKRTARYDDRGPAAGTLNPRNTFETFVVGSNNQMAHAASMAVAQAPAQAYNPLFLYGDTGLGKTHLMHAIGHAIIRHNPEARVAYLSTEKFTNEFIQGLQENSLTRFRQRYRHADVLLLDDVQFLAGKERIQEEFFHTFNDLFESGKHIVLTSDRRASEIQKLEARLVSRFEWGLPADIQAPDFETRLAILRTRAAQQSSGRGLLNSSLGVQAGQAALYDAAMPMATQDASTYADSAKTNAGERNTNSRFNADAVNDAGQFNANAANTRNNGMFTAATGIFNDREDRTFKAGENVLDRTFQTGERVAGQAFTGSENALGRGHQTSLQNDAQAFTGSENALGRGQQTSLQNDAQSFTAEQQSMQNVFNAGENAKQNAWQAEQTRLGRALSTSERVASEVFSVKQTATNFANQLAIMDKANGTALAGSYRNSMGSIQKKYDDLVTSINNGDGDADVKAKQIEDAGKAFVSSQEFTNNIFQMTPGWSDEWETLLATPTSGGGG